MLSPVNSSKRRRIAWGVLLVVMLALPLFDQSLFAQSSPPAADAFVSSSFAKTNFGSSIALVVQNGATTYVQFNLSGIPAGATVTKASLRLYVDAVAGSGKFDVYNVSSNWSENSVTYNSRPALGNSVSQNGPFSITASSMNQFLLVDITPELQGWLNGTIPNNGVALQLTGSGGSFSIDSKESLLTGNGPELEISLAGTPGPQGPAGPQGATGLTGAQGPAGPKGDTGATGAQGPVGPNGSQGPQGPVGLTGAQGPQGNPGPQGPAGTNGTGFTFRNGFDINGTYDVNDVVAYNGATYVALVANRGEDPPDVNPQWSLMAQAGAPGPQGAAGLVGPQGSQGPQGQPGLQGSTGPKGDTGAQGPQGPVGPASNAVMTFSAFLRGDLKDISASSGFIVVERPISIIRVTASPGEAAVNPCSQPPQLVIEDFSLFSPIYTLTLAGSPDYWDSGSIAVPVNTGVPIRVISFPASGCGLFGDAPGDVWVNVQYVMQ